MTDEPEIPKKRKRNRQNEYARDKLARKNAAAIKAASEELSEEEMTRQLAVLAIRSKDMPTDTDRDIDFAYKNSGNPAITPLEAPSLGAWQWYEYAKSLPDKFLEICAKREDAKAKSAGSINAQRMEDDKRQQFAVIDRIIKHLEADVKAITDDLMKKCSEDLLHACRKHKGAWKAYFQKFPILEDELK